MPNITGRFVIFKENFFSSETIFVTIRIKRLEYIEYYLPTRTNSKKGETTGHGPLRVIIITIIKA